MAESERTLLVGIDPGARASGVAVYEDGKLELLAMMTLPQLAHYIASHDEARYAIEDVNAIRPVYARNNKGSRAMVSKIAQNVGQVKQAGSHIIEFLEYYNRPYRALPPMAGNWGSLSDTEAAKRILKERTGWDKPTNKDTRAAAFFGWVAMRSAA